MKTKLRSLSKILVIVLFFACESKQKDVDTGNLTGTNQIKNVIQFGESGIDSVKSKDSILLTSFIDKKNNELKKEFGDLENQKIYTGNIIYPKDSTFLALNFFGEYSGGATYNPYAENIIIKNNNLITSKIEGEIFRIDKFENNEYLFYTNNYSRLSNHIKIFKSSFQNDSLITNEVDKRNYGNYLFNFIRHKREHPDSIDIKIDLKNWNDNETLKSLGLINSKIGLNEYYKTSDEPFLEIETDENKETEPQFMIYYKYSYGDQLEKFLRIKNRDKSIDFILAMEGGDGQDTYSLSTEFLTDTTLINIYTHKQTAIDNTHLMAYATDSIVTKFKYNKLFEFREIKKDSFHIYEKYPTYHKNLKGKVFKTWSEVFTINGIGCRWEYEVKYTDETNENSKEPLVNLISQKLISWKTKMLLLDLDLSKFIFLPPKSIADLEHNKYPDSSIDNLKDVNSDNYTDIQFMTEHAGGGANIAYATYLFNSKNKKFEYSEVFSGYNIEYDKEKNRISTFGKGAVNDYYYSFENLKDNRKDIEFTENIRHYEDTIFYTKLINNKVVKEKVFVLGEYENWVKYLERK